MPVEIFHGAGIDVHKETAVVTIFWRCIRFRIEHTRISVALYNV